MSRWNGTEIHEHSWFPREFRDELTGFLGFFAFHSGIYRHTETMIAELLEATGERKLTDLCSGGGFYPVKLAKRLKVSVELTDLFPSSYWKSDPLFLESSGIVCRNEPLNAINAPEQCGGVLTMFSATHHFPENFLRGLLRSAAEHGRPLAFFDYSRRAFWSELPPILLSPLFVWSISPFIYPFSWKRMLFSYLLPVLPATVLVDGALSRMRAYRPEELAELLPEVQDYEWKSGVYPYLGGLTQVSYIIGKPVKK